MQNCNWIDGVLSDIEIFALSNDMMELANSIIIAREVHSRAQRAETKSDSATQLSPNNEGDSISSSMKSND